VKKIKTQFSVWNFGSQTFLKPTFLATSFFVGSLMKNVDGSLMFLNYSYPTSQLLCDSYFFSKIGTESSLILKMLKKWELSVI
jgi:hypothetical protein